MDFDSPFTANLSSTDIAGLDAWTMTTTSTGTLSGSSGLSSTAAVGSTDDALNEFLQPDNHPGIVNQQQEESTSTSPGSASSSTPVPAASSVVAPPPQSVPAAAKNATSTPKPTASMTRGGSGSDGAGTSSKAASTSYNDDENNSSKNSNNNRSGNAPTVPESARVIPPDEPVEVCDICQRVFKGAKRSTHKQQHIRRLHPLFYTPKRGGKKRSSVGPNDKAVPASQPAGAPSTTTTSSGIAQGVAQAQTSQSQSQTQTQTQTQAKSPPRPNQGPVQVQVQAPTQGEPTSASTPTGPSAANSKKNPKKNTTTTVPSKKNTNTKQEAGKPPASEPPSTQAPAAPPTPPPAPVKEEEAAAVKPVSGKQEPPAKRLKKSEPANTPNGAESNGSATVANTPGSSETQPRQTPQPQSHSPPALPQQQQQQFVPNHSPSLEPALELLNAVSGVSSDGFISVDEASSYLQQMTNFQNKQPSQPRPKNGSKTKSRDQVVDENHTQVDLDILTLKHGIAGTDFELDQRQEQELRQIFGQDEAGSVEHYFKHELSPVMQYALTCKFISDSTMNIAIQGAIHYLTTLNIQVNEPAFWERFQIPVGNDYDQDLDDKLAEALNRDIESMCLYVDSKVPRKKYVPSVKRQDTLGNGRQRKKPVYVISFKEEEDKPWERYNSKFQ